MEKIVFTNGCFDIIHAGHVDLLERAKAFGTKLIVGLNSDQSVRAIKGAPRPFVDEHARAAVLKGLRSVDTIVIFNETTPERLIKEIKPDVLVKGGDWKINEIVGADFVLQNKGEVYSLPFKYNFSTTAIVEKVMQNSIQTIDNTFSNESKKNNVSSTIEKSLAEHLEVFEKLSSAQIAVIERCAETLFRALANKNKILLCGNGGSAADAQHIAAEFVGRFECERRAFPALALTTDTSALTAIGNDYGYERVFSRQVEALAQPGDVLIAISTSGNSPNILAAVAAARKLGCQTIGLTGGGGEKLASLCDTAVLAPSTRTARIQEAHIAIGHLWCEFVDEQLLRFEAQKKLDN